MIKIKINNSEFLVKKDISVLEACKYVGITVLVSATMKRYPLQVIVECV